MAKASFSLFRRGNPKEKVGTATFLGKSYKKAKAAGSRYLRQIGMLAANPRGLHLSVCSDPDFVDRETNIRRARRRNFRKQQHAARRRVSGKVRRPARKRNKKLSGHAFALKMKRARVAIARKRNRSRRVKR